MKQNAIAKTLGAVCAVAVLLVGVSSFAGPKDQALERARHHMELGQEAYEDGSYEEAAKQFIDAFAASPFSAFLYNAGLAFEKAQLPEKAVEFYTKYLEAEPGASDADQVKKKIQALLPGEEAPEEPAPPIVEITEVNMKSLISVRTNPEDAIVRILDDGGNEVASSKGPAAQTVVQGSYTVEASHPDFRTVETSLIVRPGEVYVVVVEMSQGAFLGFLHIETNVPGADVYIGDRSVGKAGSTPFNTVLPTGEHKIWVEKPGYQPIEKTVTVNLSEKVNLELELARLPFGMLLVKTNVPRAQVFLGEVSLGSVPLEKPVRPGKHLLKVVADGMKDYKKEIIVARGQLTKALVRMNPKPSRTSAWVSLGFSAAFFAGGGAAGIMALRLNNELDDTRNKGRLASDDPRIMKGFMWGLGADLAFGVGTIVGGLCLYYFLRDPLPPSEGKHFSPVDLETNPEDVDGFLRGEAPTRGATIETLTPVTGGGSEKPEVENGDTEPQLPAVEPGTPQSGTETHTSTDGEMTQRTGTLASGPRLMVTPLLSTQSAGLGIVVVF